MVVMVLFARMLFEMFRRCVPQLEFVPCVVMVLFERVLFELILRCVPWLFDPVPLVVIVLCWRILFELFMRYVPKLWFVPFVWIVLFKIMLLFVWVRLIPYPCAPEALLSTISQFFMVTLSLSKTSIPL